MEKNKLEWLEVGYTMFAEGGPGLLKIEALARKTGKSKSSFYHYYGDLDNFTLLLLEYHEKRGIAIAKKAEKCRSMVPDLLELFIDVSEDIFFNRQLRIHRSIDIYSKSFKKASGLVEEAFLNIWSDSLGLGNQIYLARIILNLTVENFYLQVTPETLNRSWLQQYLKEIQTMVSEMMKR